MMSLYFKSKNISCLGILFFLVFYLVVNTAKAETVFTFLYDLKVNKGKKNYSHRLLLLALEKTVHSHGSFQMNYIHGMNPKRAKEEITKNTYPNFIHPSGGTMDLFNKYHYAPFPIDLGLLNYRFPMLHQDNIDVLSKDTTLDSFKALNVIQGIGWVDSKLLSSNGFSSVKEVKPKNINNMIYHKRADIFFGSMNDIDKYKKRTVTLNSNIALYYDLPRFFISSKENKAAVERIYEGLIIAYQDSSLLALVDEFFLEKINRLDIEHRKIFNLSNPFQQGIDSRYKNWQGLQIQYLKSRKDK